MRDKWLFGVYIFWLKESIDFFECRFIINKKWRLSLSCCLPVSSSYHSVHILLLWRSKWHISPQSPTIMLLVSMLGTAVDVESIHSQMSKFLATLLETSKASPDIPHPRTRSLSPLGAAATSKIGSLTYLSTKSHSQNAEIARFITVSTRDGKPWKAQPSHKFRPFKLCIELPKFISPDIAWVVPWLLSPRLTSRIPLALLPRSWLLGSQELVTVNSLTGSLEISHMWEWCITVILFLMSLHKLTASCIVELKFGMIRPCKLTRPAKVTHPDARTHFLPPRLTLGITQWTSISLWKLDLPIFLRALLLN